MSLSQSPNIQTFYFEDDGFIPNHPKWPVILYIGTLKEQLDQAELLFNQHNWRNSWTNGVFNYTHYHSNAHEVLGVIRGSATLQIGGEHGQSVTLRAGDVVVLPAGTGHRRLQADSEFTIVGAYPNGIDYNTRTATGRDRSAILEEIKNVPKPTTDPIYGENGPLLELWREA